VSFKIIFVEPAGSTYQNLESAAQKAHQNRMTKKVKKTSKQEGLFKQVHKTIGYLAENPKHPSLNTHEYDSINNPYDASKKVFEAYAQNSTPGAYRVFWCYRPDKNEITIIAITPHP
jgi:hypothetical protein